MVTLRRGIKRRIREWVVKRMLEELGERDRLVRKYLSERDGIRQKLREIQRKAETVKVRQTDYDELRLSLSQLLSPEAMIHDTNEEASKEIAKLWNIIRTKVKLTFERANEVPGVLKDRKFWNFLEEIERYADLMRMYRKGEVGREAVRKGAEHLSNIIHATPGEHIVYALEHVVRG